MHLLNGRGFLRRVLCKNNLYLWKNNFIRLLSSNAKFEDPFDILGVRQDSDESTVKNAYFKLSKKYHPDRNPSKDAQEMFMKIHNAYRLIMERIDKQSEEEKTEDQRNNQEDPRSRAKPYSFTIEPLDVEVEPRRKFSETKVFAVGSYILVAFIAIYLSAELGYLPEWEKLQERLDSMFRDEKKERREIIVNIQRAELHRKKYDEIAEELTEEVASAIRGLAK